MSEHLPTLLLLSFYLGVRRNYGIKAEEDGSFSRVNSEKGRMKIVRAQGPARPN